MGIVNDLIYVVLAALAGGFVAHALKQPLIFGYILAGVMVGPHMAGPSIVHLHDIEMLAEIGVALLLFTLGLDFSLGELKRLARITFIGTPLQVILTSVVTYFIALQIGLGWKDALWIGSAVSLSSTMVVLKSLAAQDSLGSTAGRTMLAILIAQDLVVIPMLLILPELSTDTPDFALIVWAFVKSLAFLATMFLLGTKLFPPLFSFIARWGSRELFFLTTLGIALGIGFLTYSLGLSFALGAFVAGMLLSETDYNHQALSDIASLRDLFGLIFFVSVGMLLDPRFFIDHIAAVGGLTLAFIICKASIIGLLVRLFGFSGIVPWKVGLGLSQVGEFAFLIGNSGHRSGSLSPDAYSLLIAITVVSMILTPWLLRLAPRLYRLTGAAPHAAFGDGSRETTLKDHVVILGGGVVGRYVGRVLTAFDVPHLVVEADHGVITDLWGTGENALFGDASQRVILEAAHVQDCRLVIVSTNNDAVLPLILSEVRALNEKVPVVVRVEDIAHAKGLNDFKIHEVVHARFEVGLEMIRQSLLALGTDESRIFMLLGQLRAERYELGTGRTILSPSELRQRQASRLLNFIWHEVKGESPLGGKTLGELHLRHNFGVLVVGVISGEDFTPNPGPERVLSPGDLLGVLGTDSQLRDFSKSN